MSKIYFIFIIVMAALAIWGTEKALGQTTTILAPDGSQGNQSFVGKKGKVSLVLTLEASQ